MNNYDIDKVITLATELAEEKSKNRGTFLEGLVWSSIFYFGCGVLGYWVFW